MRRLFTPQKRCSGPLRRETLELSICATQKRKFSPFKRGPVLDGSVGSHPVAALIWSPRYGLTRKAPDPFSDHSGKGFFIGRLPARPPDSETPQQTTRPDPLPPGFFAPARHPTQKFCAPPVVKRSPASCCWCPSSPGLSGQIPCLLIQSWIQPLD